jgi:hypothetical protein
LLPRFGVTRRLERLPGDSTTIKEVRTLTHCNIERPFSFPLTPSTEVALGHPKFPKGSNAALVSLDGKKSAENYKFNGAGRAGIKNIEYSREDDAAIEQWIRENVNTTWHR